MRQTTKWHRRRWVATVFVAQWALWLAFANSAGYREILAGLASTAACSFAVVLFVKQGKVGFRFRLRDVVQIWRMPWYAVEGTWEIYRAMGLQLLGHDMPGFHGALAFRETDGHDPFQAGRRALAVTYTTMTPNFVVLGIVLEEHVLLYHQILPGEVHKITENLGAEP